MKTKLNETDQQRFTRICSAFARREDWSRLNMFRALAKGLIPDWFEWNADTENLISTLCLYRWINTKNTPRTWKNLIGFAGIWWLSDPGNSSVIICADSKAQLSRRWNLIRSLHKSLDDYGNMLNSKLIWTVSGGSICGLTKPEAIKGIHTKRQMVIVDGRVSGAAWTAARNLWTYPERKKGEYIFVAVDSGNSTLSIQPDGKMSVTV